MTLFMPQQKFTLETNAKTLPVKRHSTVYTFFRCRKDR